MSERSDKVAVLTLRDAAGAEVAREAIADAGIPVEIKRYGGDAYLGSATGSEFEVRVAADRVDDTRKLLAALEEDMEQAALAAAGVPPDADEERGSAELPAPEDRPRKLSWAIALALVGPLPGIGVLYARAFRIGWTMVGISLASIAAVVAAGASDAFGLLIALKIADVVLAPILTARFNKQLEGGNAARS